MEFNSFKKNAEKFSIVPVYRTITADLLTPVLAFMKIRKKSMYPFLLESVEGIGKIARYSFIGRDPQEIIISKENTVRVSRNGETTEVDDNLFGYLKKKISVFNYPEISELPDFSGGYVGYIGYESISIIEPVVSFNQEDEMNNPDAILGLFKELLVFDHFRHRITIISNVEISGKEDLKAQYDNALKNIENIMIELKNDARQSKFSFSDINQHFSDNSIKENIGKCLEDITKGEVFQIVMSGRFSAGFEGDILNVYRALRIINPSPYMYFLEMPDDLIILGTSPEDLLKVRGKKAEILPIAGTRKRGTDVEEDKQLEKDLLSDPKEIAEHMMLIDLARNDLGRISRFGTVRITEKKQVHRFSHVMHIVSRVEGYLREGVDCIDAFKASFPAGTVTGAPKIRAMQLLGTYEKVKRNIYAGAIGYIDFKGNMDMCIAIRTLFSKKNRVFWQAGAGIVADSNPDSELIEINNKSAVMVSALKFAGEIDDSCN